MVDTEKKLSAEDIIEEREIIDEKGIDIGNICFIPPEKLATEFCEGFNTVANHLVKSSGINTPKKFSCRSKKIENPIPKELEELSLNIQDVYNNYDIDLVQTDSITKEERPLGEGYTIKRKQGKKDGDICKIDKIQRGQKFCEGYLNGHDMLIPILQLNKDVYLANCKIKTDQQGEAFKTVFGVVRN